MDDKQIQILKASLKLFVKKGLHTVTFSQIADEANVGMGTIYKYFKSKEDIVQQIWIWQKKHESEFIFKGFEPTDNVKEQFFILWKRVILYFIKNSLEFQFSYHFASSPILTDKIHKVAMKDFLIFDDMFEKGIQQKLFKPLKARHLRLYTFSNVNGWILWAKDEKIQFSDETINLFLTMAWDSIRK